MRLLSCFTRLLMRGLFDDRLKQRLRNHGRHWPEGNDCLEERLLLSRAMPAASPVPAWLSPGSMAGTGQARQVSASRNHQTSRHAAPVHQIVYSNITYTTAQGHAEKLDVYLPGRAPPPQGWPVIMAIHGGGWRRFDKREYGRRIASAFVAKGYAVVAPNYPLSSPGKPSWPLNLQDIEAAVRWVKHHASDFSIDPNRVVAMGESAGGNLAELLGTSSPGAQADASGVSAAVEAVVSYSGPSDLAALYAQSPQAGKAVAQFLGGPPSAVPARYAGASPASQVSPSDPPFFLVHGGSDTLVPIGQSREMDYALAAAGVPHRLVVLPRAGHNLDFPIQTPKNLLFQILEFLDTTWNDNNS